MSISASCETPASLRLQRQAGGEGGVEVVQRLAGAGGNDQRSDKGNLDGAMPAAETGEGVGAHEAEKGVAGRQLGVQGDERLERVVGGAGGIGGVGQREGKGGVGGNRQTGHGQAVFKAGYSALRLERLRSHGGEEHGVEAESRPGGACYAEMAEVGRVESAAEKGDAAAAAGLLTHMLIVIFSSILICNECAGC